MLEAVQAQAEAIDTETEATSPLHPQGSRLSKPAADLALRTLSSSASKPPPTHPILKKARGPSSSGPRPTARFVSPHESDDADDIPSSGSTAATTSDAPVSVLISPKPPPVPSSKKLVVTPAARGEKESLKKQSAVTSSDYRIQQTGSPKRPHHANMQRSTPHIQQGTRQTTLVSAGNPDKVPMSEKARGKQPATPNRAASEKHSAPEKNSASESNRLPSRDSRLRLSQYEQSLNHRPRHAALAQAGSLIDLSSHSRRRESGASRSTFGVGSFESGTSNGTGPPMARSQSHQRLHNNLRAPAHGLFTGATSGTSSVAVTGTIADQSGLGSTPVSSMLGYMPIQNYSMAAEPQQVSTFDSRAMTPTQPTTSTSVPLGRTKSQLTLILEREKGRGAQRQ